MHHLLANRIINLLLFLSIVLGMNFIELMPDEKRNIVENTWNEVLNILTTHFQQASADSSTVKQSFEGEFPKLIRLFNDLWSRYSFSPPIYVQPWSVERVVLGAIHK